MPVIQRVGLRADIDDRSDMIAQQRRVQLCQVQLMRFLPPVRPRGNNVNGQLSHLADLFFNRHPGEQITDLPVDVDLSGCP